MNWKKWFKKKKIVLPFVKKPKTLEEVAKDSKVGDTYYFRIEQGLKKVEELVLYAKTPIGYNTTSYKLPLHTTFITLISTKCKGNQKFWKQEIVRALERHWKLFSK